MQRPEATGGDMEHPFSSASRPAGRPVVWIGTEWAPVEYGPMDLPGIVTSDLPDGWALVTWVDKDSWYSPDAVFETKFLKELSRDDFERRVTTLRESDWEGLTKQPISEPKPANVVGETVRWVGTGRGLTPSHPGTIVEIDSFGRLRVRWVDRVGEFEDRQFVYPINIRLIDADEAARLTQALRDSDWPGLTPDA